METRSPTVYRNYCKIRNKVKNMIKYTRKQKEKCISGNIKKNPKQPFGNILNPKPNQILLSLVYMLILKIVLAI